MKYLKGLLGRLARDAGCFIALGTAYEWIFGESRFVILTIYANIDVAVIAYASYVLGRWIFYDAAFGVAKGKMRDRTKGKPK